MKTQQAIAGSKTSESKTAAARRNARLPRSKRGALPTFSDRELARLLLLEIKTMHGTVNGPMLRKAEMRVNEWPITEIATRLLG